MSALANILFPEPSLRRSPLAVVRWWESRRLTYNLVVGATGVVTYGILAATIFLPSGMPLSEWPWRAVLGYGLAANVCYTFGPIAETTLERWVGRTTYGLGPALFRHGLVFSVGLTMFPVAIAAIYWLGRIAAAIL